VYPGRFEYHVPAFAYAYSLPGLLWVPLLVVGAVRVVRVHALKRTPGERGLPS